MPQTIKDLIRKNFITASLTVIILMEIVTVSAFVVLINTIERNASHLLSESIEENIALNTSANANHVSEKLYDVSNITTMLQSHIEEFFMTIEDVPMPNINGNYKYHDNGSFYDADPTSISGLYYAGNAFQNDFALEKALKTERFNQDFIAAKENYPIIDQLYFNSWDGMTRIYPYVEDLPGLLGPNMDINQYNFYYIADETHNPNREVVWTDVYLDPAGLGWMISCIAPIYNGDFLEGVFGADITIDHLITGLLDIRSDFDTPVLLIDDTGLIIAMNENTESLLGLQELKTHIYEEVVTETVLKSDAYNIFKLMDNEFQKSMTELIDSEETNKDMMIGNENYYVVKRDIENTRWQLIVFANEAEVLKPVAEIEALTRNVLGLILIFLVILNIIILRVVTEKSEKISGLVSEPLNQLKVRIQNLGQNRTQPSNYLNTNIEEIDVLNFEFFIMSQTLADRTDKLIQTEIEKKEQSKKMATYLKEALTDKLTDLTNRRGIEDYLDTIFEKSDFSCDFALILFDIDHFKRVNDNYGHLAGDEVLIEIAKILKNHYKESQHIARWGGEEFMILLENTTIEKAIIAAETMRTTIENHKFSINEVITASFGVATVNKVINEKRTLIQHADNALYDAKSDGRNCVKYHS